VTFRQLNLGEIDPTTEFTSHQTQLQHKDLGGVHSKSEQDLSK